MDKEPMGYPMKCEGCGVNDVPEDNVQRVCAYQLDPITEHGPHGYCNTPTCNCCHSCRDLCRN